jgi:hypothetical protein
MSDAILLSAAMAPPIVLIVATFWEMRPRLSPATITAMRHAVDEWERNH